MCSVITQVLIISRHIVMSTMAIISSISLLSLFLVSISMAAADHNGFTLDLIHRDSPSSPLQNPNATGYTSIRSAITRSIARANRFKTVLGLDSDSETKTVNPESVIVSSNGEYLMNISIGTPPFPIMAIADTGSDLVWTQCKPCANCYEQTSPIFDPQHSSTYKPIPCSAPECTTQASGFDPACSQQNICQYQVRYGDNSQSTGTIAFETLILGPATFPNTIFGCGFDNQGTFSEAGSGIIGLGAGSDSLIGQLDKTISGKFSYCLVPLSSKTTHSSQLSFGQKAVVALNNGVVSTSLVVNKTPATYYYLTLEAITIGKSRIAFADGTNSGGAVSSGNIIIDSGTTLTLLPVSFYTKIQAEVEKQVEAKRADDPSNQLNLCYDAAEFKAPEMVVNFEGADLKLKDFNAWVMVADDVVCFAFAESSLAIYGNLAQMNFLVGYDKEAKTVSFKPADCTKHG